MNTIFELWSYVSDCELQATNNNNEEKSSFFQKLFAEKKKSAVKKVSISKN